MKIRTAADFGGWLSRFGRWLYELAIGTPREERSYAPISFFIGKRLRRAGYSETYRLRLFPFFDHFMDASREKVQA
jgi:hypothetical protein